MSNSNKPDKDKVSKELRFDPKTGRWNEATLTKDERDLLDKAQDGLQATRDRMNAFWETFDRQMVELQRLLDKLF